MKYKDIDFNAVRDCALNFLLTQNVGSYPVNPKELCSKMGWELITLRDYAQKAGINPQSVREDLFLGCDAYTFYFSKTGEYKIIYDKRPNCSSRLNFTIAHEIGHILLGHHRFIKNSGGILSVNQNDRFELEADFFAGNFLAAPVILNALDISSSVQIEHICRISKSAAENRKRALDMWRSYRYCSDTEMQLLRHFTDYIHNMDSFKKSMQGELLGFR